jgi:hypothetical protein
MTRTRPCPAAASEPSCEDWAAPVWLGDSIAAAPAGGAGRGAASDEGERPGADRGDCAPLDDPGPDTAASNETMRRGGSAAVLVPDGPAPSLGGGGGACRAR